MCVLRRLTTAFIAVSVALGSAAPAWGSTLQVLDPAPPDATVQAVTPYKNYQWPFKSQATCKARGATVYEFYKGTHHGAMHSWRCVHIPTPNTCGGTKVWVLQARFYDLPSGPVSAPAALGASGREPSIPLVYC